MVAGTVARRNDAFINFGVLSYVVANTKKCCFGLHAPQLFQNKFSWAGYRTIIKGEVYPLIYSR